MSILINQTNFTHGEIAPTLRSRYNLDVYSKAAKKLRNVVVIPHGGVKRRFGTRFIDDLTVKYGVFDSDYMLVPFEYEAEEKYLLIVVPNKIYIYQDDVEVAEVDTPYPEVVLTTQSLKYSTAHQLMIFVHEDYPPRELKKDPANPGEWLFDEISFKNQPTYDFDRNYDNILFQLTEVTVGDDRELRTTTNFFPAGEPDKYVGGLFIGAGESLSERPGVARITAFISETAVQVDILSPFANGYKVANKVKGTNIQLTEKVWSDSRGWPRTVTFFENRLWFGGTKSLPSNLFGSVIFDNFNFNTGAGYADEAIIGKVDAGANKNTTIINLDSANSLQVFTVSTEFASVGENFGPLKPGAGTAFKRQSASGSENVLPHVVKNETFYVKRGGRGVMSFVFDNSTQGYQSIEDSILASHIILNPIDSGVFEGSFIEDASYLMLVNDDGTLVVYQTLLAEKVSAWTLSDTQGKFKRIASLGDEVYFVVDRTINGVSKKYLEKLDWDLYTDCTYVNNYGVPTDVITGLEFLEGEEVWVRGDDYVLNRRTVVNGEIEIEREVLEVEVGFNYYPEIETLPLNMTLQTGPIFYLPKRIGRIYVDYYESAGVYVDGVLIPDKEFEETFDYPPATGKTGIAEIDRFEDWKPLQTVTISQVEPLPMTLLGIGYKLEIS
jgi:hypothetical protein